MLIGLDFDNTIVRYDRVFHSVAQERGLIGDGVPASKVAVRDTLRADGHEEEWIAIQGYVYGCRMADADMFEGVADVLRWARETGHDCAIISHKTKHPYRGPKYDLHAAAAEWIEDFLTSAEAALVPSERVSFHETKDDKLAQIKALGCDIFLDDLPEILAADAFPPKTRGILFDPDGHHGDWQGGERVTSWAAFRDALDT